LIEQFIEEVKRRAIVTTGSPLRPVTTNGITHAISRSNVYISPSASLGVPACGGSEVTDEVLMAAAESRE